VVQAKRIVLRATTKSAKKNENETYFYALAANESKVAF